MSSINEKLDYLNDTKQLIRSSLVQRGQTVDDSTPFRDYASKILNIDTQSDFIDNRTVINDFTYQNDGYYKDMPNPDDYKVNTTVLCIGNLYSAESVLEQTAFVIYQIMSVSDGNAHCKVVDILDEYNVGDIKLFETIENMNNDETAKEGDLAIVYRNEIQNMKANTQTQYITFPETVTLPEAFTSSSYLRLRAVDMSIMFDGNIQLDQTSFRFDGFSESGMIRVSYSSDDGITYTRDEFMGDSGDLTNPVDLGTIVHCAMSEEWNNNLGYFMQVGGNVFDGLYEYTKDKQISYITSNKGTKIYIPEFREIYEDGGSDNLHDGLTSEDSLLKVETVDEHNRVLTGKFLYNLNNDAYINEQKDLIAFKSSYGRYRATDISVNWEESKVYYTNLESISLPDDTVALGINLENDTILNRFDIYTSVDKTDVYQEGQEFDYDLNYQMAQNQYTLISSNQLLENISAYGKDGNIVGSMKNNGELNYTPSDEEQTIPAGYTSGGSVAPISSSAIPNLVPENVVYGKQILDVVGITPDGSDFELVTTNSLGAIQATTSPGKSFSNHPYFTNTIIVDSNGEPLGGFMAKGSNVYTFGWNGKDIVNKKTYSTSSLGISSINEDSIYASNPDEDMSGIVGFICGSSHYVYFLTYEVKYTIENGVMCPSLEISNKKGKWRIYDSAVITTQAKYLAFNPWNKYSCVCHGANKKDVFIRLNAPTNFDSYTECESVQYTRSSLTVKGHFAKNGEVFYVREGLQDSQADVYYLTNDGLPAKKNNLGLIFISSDGVNGMNYNGNKVTLSYSDDGTVSINTGERIEGFQTNRLYKYGVGSITNKVYVVQNGEWTPVIFYDIDWDNNTATKFGEYTPVKGKDFGYIDQHSLEDCGSNALFGACTNPSGYNYTAYPRMFFVNRNLDEIIAIKYKGELYYPNTLTSEEYQRALDTAIEIKGE